MNILVIDNYDSFVFNLVHILKNIANVKNVIVKKNDKISLSEVSNFQKILLSPGPSLPKDAGLMPKIIQEFSSTKSILGVCLGHQAIAEAFGGSLHNLANPLHGVASDIELEKEDYLFENTAASFKIGHYHSWVVNNDLPNELECIATDKDNHIMALRHKNFDVRGVQFHPESVLTEHGIQMITNWVNF